MADVGGAIAAVIESAQRRLENPDIGMITVRSNLGSFSTNVFATDNQANPLGDFLGNLVRPKITAETPFGVVNSTPYGEPSEIPWLGLVITALVIIGGVVVYRKLRR